MPYKVKFKGYINGYNTKVMTAVLVVSVDPHYDYTDPKLPYFEGEQFEAICKSLAAFKKVSIVIADSLQRFNLMAEGIKEEQARQRSIECGQQWYERNKQYIERWIKNLDRIYHWDDLLKSEDYQTFKTYYTAEYEKDVKGVTNAWRDAVFQTAGKFVTRVKGRSDVPEKTILDYSRQYALEEAILTASWSNRDWNFHLYPKPNNDCVDYALTQIVKAKAARKLMPLEVILEPEKKQTLDADELIEREEQIEEPRAPSPPSSQSSGYLSAAGSPHPKQGSPKQGSPKQGTSPQEEPVLAAHPPGGYPAAPLSQQHPYGRALPQASLMSQFGLLQPQAAATNPANSYVSLSHTLSWQDPTNNPIVQMHVNERANILLSMLRLGSGGNTERFRELFHTSREMLRKGIIPHNADASITEIIKVVQDSVNFIITTSQFPIPREYNTLLIEKIYMQTEALMTYFLPLQASTASLSPANAK